VQFQAGDPDETPEPKLVRWSSRDDAVGGFRPSRRLMRRAFDERRSVVHMWTDDDSGSPMFTMSSDLDWAFCTPIPEAGHERWCLYVSGRRKFTGVKDISSPSDLLAELKLAELMAQFIGAVRQVRVLEHVHSEMRQFFSPAVVETLTGEQCQLDLEPRQGPVSVLFCDVRGFSKKVEESSDDLHAVLARVREALSVMTRAIMKYEGVIADFQGDAALAFWGWPTANQEASVLACRSALAIHNAFAAAQHDPDHPLYGFRVGIGIGHGDAIAGRIGSDEQIKVGVFGPVVNLASRLENLTKVVGAPILVDGPTAADIADVFSPSEGTCRRVTRMRPPGMDAAVEVFALTSAQGDPLLSNADLANFERAGRAVEAGDWAEARHLLQGLPLDDGPANFLRVCLHEMGSHAPQDWDGALPVCKLSSLGRNGAATAAR
jgi:adenylate cyclase